MLSGRYVFVKFIHQGYPKFTEFFFQTLNRGQIRPEETQYLVKNLVGGRTYYFRVLANSVKSYESSDEVKFPVPARVKVK